MLKGVRGIKLGRTESLETIHLLDGTEDDPIVMYKEKTGSFEPFENRAPRWQGKPGEKLESKQKDSESTFTQKEVFHMAELQNTPTPHIRAKQGEIAGDDSASGDPLRAKYIAEHFLTDAKQFNTTRNMYGYTGYYQGQARVCHGNRHGLSVDGNLFV